MEVLTQLGAVTEWKSELAKAFKLGQFENGGVIAKLQEFADTYGASIGSVKAQYYKYKNLGIPSDIDTSGTDAVQGSQEPSYEAGATVEVRVTSVETYGAKVVTTDGYGTIGLIHISELASAFVSDVTEYAKVGEILTARILKFDEKARLSLSLRNAPKQVVKRIENEAPTPVVVPHAVNRGEHDLMFSHLTAKIGELSPSARQMFAELAQEFGAFAVGMEVGQVDVGELVAKAIRDKMGRCL